MEEKNELTNHAQELQLDVNVEELELKETPSSLNHNETMLRDDM